MEEMKGPGDHSVDVMVTMRTRLLERLDTHLRKVGESNRSAWVRRAIMNQITREHLDMELLEEVE